MRDRHQKLGIKQTIQKNWMDRVVQMMLTGMSEQEIRSDLDQFLSTQKQSGGIGKRGDKTYGMSIGILASWFSPDKELESFCQHALQLARECAPAEWLPLHWAVISASYPFWVNVAKQVGRLLNLQDKVTQRQIFDRLKEQYGDRETVSRNARYTVRSFVAWDVLQDTDNRGSYRKCKPIPVYNENTAMILIESVLHAQPEGQIVLNNLLSSPALFPFQLQVQKSVFTHQMNERIEVIRLGMDEEMLKLRR